MDGKLLPCLEFVLPFCADFHDSSAELMADDHRMHVDILRNPLVLLALDRSLVAGHTDAVRHNLSQDFILGNLRERKFIQPQIVFAVQSNRLCIHRHTTF